MAQLTKTRMLAQKAEWLGAEAPAGVQVDEEETFKLLALRYEGEYETLKLIKESRERLRASGSTDSNLNSVATKILEEAYNKYNFYWS